MEDPNFIEDLYSTADQYLKPPRASDRVVNEHEIIAALLADNPGQAFQVISHDTPITSDDDIDYAEHCGNWTHMLNAYLESDHYTWATVNGFKPDLREWDL